MIISEKQIMQLMSIVGEYSDKLKSLGFESIMSYAYQIDELLGSIHSQQSKELKAIE